MKRLIPALLILGILVTSVAVGASVLGVDPTGAVTPTDRTTATPTPTPTPESAAVTRFEQADARCVADQQRDLDVEENDSGGASYVTIAQNVSVEDAGHALVRPTVERVGEDRYVLNVTSNESEGMAAQCLAVIRYEATVRLPSDDYTLVVRHDGERVATVRDGEDGSAAGAKTGGSA